MEVSKLRELFAYDPVSGLLTWKVRRKMAVGTVAGCLHHHRNTVYRRVMVEGRSIYAHQIAWAIHYGIWPDFIIDHEDRNGLNNSIKNLRGATTSNNLHNAKIYATNKSGFKGVCFSKTLGKWQAYIYKDRAQIHLGYFETPEQAHRVRLDHAKSLLGEFAQGEI